MNVYLIGLFLILNQCLACGQPPNTNQNKQHKMNDSNSKINMVIDSATFGGGCFWCTEAQLLQLKGVQRVVSGYMGGHIDNPTYKEVCTGNTGHAEVVHVFFDPSVISFDELLAAFFVSHDPTQLNRQGNDYGTQYRSVVFYHNMEQKSKTESYIRQMNEQKVYPDPIVTQVAKATKFYPAEDYHQNYYQQNGQEPYCRYVIQPKMEHFRKIFNQKIKQ